MANADGAAFAKHRKERREEGVERPVAGPAGSLPEERISSPTDSPAPRAKGVGFERAGDQPNQFVVRTATLVAPRVRPPASLKRTNTRLRAGSKGITPAAATKTPNVGVAFASSICNGHRAECPQPMLRRISGV